MDLVARTLAHIANTFLADPQRPNQRIARANAAEASAALGKRRQQRDDVEAYLRALRTEDS